MIKKLLLLLFVIGAVHTGSFAQDKKAVKDSLDKKEENDSIRIVNGIKVPKSIILADSAVFFSTKVTKHKTDTLKFTEKSEKASTPTSSTKVSSISSTGSIQSVSSGTVAAGRTAASIDVSPSGAIAYAVPIAVPPGIGSVVPQIGLAYSSQAGSGLAGFGWNISGLSSISRIPSTKFHDNFTSGVNFDINDRFALDGQRLIVKSGTYGGDGAEYQTENYSNVKIISRGVSPFGANHGPAYFEVYYPDGSKAFYGFDSNSRTKTDFALTYSENPLNVRISYTYLLEQNTLAVSSIKYGALGSSAAPNEIKFIYKGRNAKNPFYIGGELFSQNKILSEINVLANSIRYRNYVLTHNVTQPVPYERITSIQEFNGAKDQSFEPITFDYPSTNSNITSTPYSMGTKGIQRTNTNVISDDFDGNGRMDLLIPKGKMVYLFKDPVTTSSLFRLDSLEIGYFKEVVSLNTLTHNNKLLTEQGISVVKNLNDSTVTFDIYGPGGISSGLPFLLRSQKVWNNAGTPPYRSGCLTGGYSKQEYISRKYLSGDFNGDGLGDIIAINYGYDQKISDSPSNCGSTYQPITCCNVQTTPANSEIKWFNFAPSAPTTDFGRTISVLPKPLGPGNTILTADFNGDGKTDILYITEGKMYVYGFNQKDNPTPYMSLLWETPDTKITRFAPIVGDFNGDGKTDVIFPKDNTNYPENGKYGVFLSTGKGFSGSEQVFPFYNNYAGWINDIQYGEYTLMAIDINGDGKSDIIQTSTLTGNGNPNGSVTITPYKNIISASGVPSFQTEPHITQNSINLIHFPIPVFLTSDKPKSEIEFGLFSDATIRLYDFQKDLAEEGRLKSVTQDGVAYNIDYKPLMEEAAYNPELALYKPDNGLKQTFPYVDIERAPGLKVVSKLRRTVGSSQLQQVFGYREAVSNTEGLGFLGFSQVIKSNWHTSMSDNNRIFSVTVNDPKLRGATIKSFTSKNASPNAATSNVTPAPPTVVLATPSTGAKTVTASQSISLMPGFSTAGSNGTFIANIATSDNVVNDNGLLSDYITRVDYTYDTQLLLPSKVFINKPIAVNTKDLLSGTNTSVSYKYDAYNNVTEESTKYSDAGTQTVAITLENSTTTPYYFGRPKTKKTTLNNGSDTYTTEDQFIYTGYLPTQIKKKGHNTAFITENLEYDAYGNVTKKSVVSPGGIQRTTQMEYDLSGRFMNKLTDAEGLVTTYTYYVNTGNVDTKTDVDNITTTYEYDSWGRLTRVFDYRGSSNTSYTKSGNSIIISKSDDAGSANSITTDALGNTTEVKEKNVLGNWIYQFSEYDIYGRKYRDSEPTTATTAASVTQWNTSVFDEYGRLKQATAYTGKVTTIAYDKLSTTVTDNTKSVTTTKNALGHVTSTKDPGGTINNTYYANGNLKSADYSGSTQTIEQDGWGRKTKLTDPSAGVYTYAYNGFGETTLETTPKGSTAYTYDNNGKILTKRIQGDATDMSYQYAYDPTSKLLTGLNLTNTDGNNASYSYTYDSYKRLSTATEDNEYARFVKTLTYDSFGRVFTETSEAKNETNNKTATKTLVNNYVNGGLKFITDNSTGVRIWEVISVNARSQVTMAYLHSSAMKQTNAYDDYGFPQEMKTEKLGATNTVLMDLDYTFDPLKANLSNRNNSMFPGAESFAYDGLDRLTSFNDINGPQIHTYDIRGRITNNSALGDYQFLNNNSYQQTGLNTLTSTASTYYQARKLQQISYNAFKSPVEIAEQGKEKISFQYNAAQQRSHMYYGDEAADKMSRRYRRHYSEDGSMEITEDMQAGTTSFVFYMGGDAYSAPALWKEVHSNTTTTITQNLYYLHRDYQGSILLITDNQGVAKEKRQFDAWGNIVKLTDGNGNNLAAFVITDRGYTGHEHLMGVGLIHMNGRLYDAKLHRFLQPDNFVQDPSNTQNFNRYGYVLNNPTKYTDPSGEVPLLAVFIMSGLVNVAFNLDHIDNFAQGFGYLVVGGTASLVGAGVGSGMSSFIGGSTGFIPGAAVGASSSFASGFTSGFGNALMGGSSLNSAFYSGFNNGIAGAITGGIMGGISGGLNAVRNDANFFSGKTTLDLSKGIGAHNISNTNQTVEAKYVGKYRDGIPVYESQKLGDYRASKELRSGGITLPSEAGGRIAVGQGVFSRNYDPFLMKHEFGHILQARKLGLVGFYNLIGKGSLMSGAMDGKFGHEHKDFWTETWANYESYKYFKHQPGTWPTDRFPIKDLSLWDTIRIRTATPLWP